METIKTDSGKRLMCIDNRYDNKHRFLNVGTVYTLSDKMGSGLAGIEVRIDKFLTKKVEVTVENTRRAGKWAAHGIRLLPGAITDEVVDADISKFAFTRETVEYIGNVPSWARDLVETVSAKWEVKPSVKWTRAAQNKLGHSRDADKAVVINARHDESLDKATLLHELAHLVDTGNGHGHSFYRVLYPLYERHLNENAFKVAVAQEQRYMKTAGKALNRYRMNS